MDKDNRAASGMPATTARVQETFHLHKRGFVLVFAELDGAIPGPGVVKSVRGSASFSGPEIVDFVDRSHALAVIAREPDAKDNFAKGDRVSFEFSGPEPALQLERDRNGTEISTR